MPSWISLLRVGAPPTPSVLTVGTSGASPTGSPPLRAWTTPPGCASPSAGAERDGALVAILGLTGLGVSELVSLSLGSLRRDSSGELVLVTGAGGQEHVVALQPGLGDLIDAYLASRKAWLGSERPDAALFIDASAQPMTSSKVQYLIQRLYERSGLDSHVPEGAAVQALHATFVAEAMAHWAEVLREGLTAPPSA